MLNKYFTSAAVVAGLLLTASGAHATATGFSCAINDAACQNSFKAMGNNSRRSARQRTRSTGASLPRRWVWRRISGAIANAASETTPQNDTVVVKASTADRLHHLCQKAWDQARPAAAGRTFVAEQSLGRSVRRPRRSVLFTASSTITLSFGIPLIGLGIDAEVFNSGTYTGNAERAYNSAGVLLTSVSQGGTSTGATSGVTSSEGTVPFVGITTDAANNATSLANLGIFHYVTRLTATCNSAVLGGCTSSGGFAIDTSLLYHYPISNPTPPSGNTPEPGTMSLLGAGLAGLGYFRRRRNKA